MRTIPQDIFDRVHELALGMVNSSDVDDSALNDYYYQKLLSFYHEQLEAGRSDPFLTEALADFTADVPESVRYYLLALEQARAYPEEPLYTKMISLAERLIELGYHERAEAYLRDGLVDARCVDDADAIREAERLLRDCAGL